ncbi:hypothetical protein [Fructobacillus parabroussonetiae]|uniref:Lipoprotein n=1 Tax=Fructobacillus parabroussonetiae TaxID=2713174 RepID=A0ABS5QX20_9LACO|nr:hypothetical protein [Fructobacillus parabroussonetiae]MBS9337749.1 hypothetical protein [Fructobacillus parabroussonetiae]
MKKIVITIVSLVGAAFVIFGAFQLGTTKNNKHEANISSTFTFSSSNHNSISESKSSSIIKKNIENSNNYDPNKTVEGNTVDSNMITKVTKELTDAGLPANEWAPSDIKSIITQSSQQGISAVDYAKQNYHQN